MMFGSAPVVGKFALAAFPPNAIVGFRVGGAAIAFLLLQSLTGNLRLERTKDYFQIAGFSLIGVVFNQLLFFNGLKLTTATNTSLLAVLIPIFAVIVSVLFGFDRLNWVKILGIAAAAGGVIYLVNPANASFSANTFFGDLIIVANCLFYATYVALSKDVVERNGALKALTWLFCFGGLICIPVGLCSLSNVDFSLIESSAWRAILSLVIFQTITAYFLNAWALVRVPPSVVAVYIYLQPLIGFTFAVLFLDEHFSVRAVIAAVLIFSGVFLVTRRRKTNIETDIHETLR